jgi:hypothetical protein
VDSRGRLHDLEFTCPRCGAARDHTSLSLVFVHAEALRVPPVGDGPTPPPRLGGQPLLDTHATTSCCDCRFSLRVWDLAITGAVDGHTILIVRPRERTPIGAHRGR